MRKLVHDIGTGVVGILLILAICVPIYVIMFGPLGWAVDR